MRKSHRTSLRKSSKSATANNSFIKSPRIEGIFDEILNSFIAFRNTLHIKKNRIKYRYYLGWFNISAQKLLKIKEKY
jgi:hypothetical protein